MMSVLRSRRGVVLLVSIAVLAVLAILAATFASLSRMERDVSRNYVDKVRSKLLAQAGIEAAVESVRTAIQGTNLAPQNFSCAEDLGKPWMYGIPAGGAVTYYEPSVPVDRAIFCSFSYNTTTNTNTTVKLSDRTNKKAGTTPAEVALESAYSNNDFGVSGFMPGTYTQKGDFYSLKVVDAASKIFINGPGLEDDNPTLGSNPPPVTYLQDSVVALLNNLSQILQQEQGLAFIDLGKRISDLRNQMGRNFVNVEELLPALGTTPAQQKAALAIIRPYITTLGNPDSSTLAPNSLAVYSGGSWTHAHGSDPTIQWNPTWRTTPSRRSLSEAPRRGGDKRVAEATMPDGPAQECACPTMSGGDRSVSNDPSQRWITGSNPGASPTPPPGQPPNQFCRTPRVPVNMNTASRIVLQAVLSNLRGGYLNRMAGPSNYFGDGYNAPNTVIVTPGTNQLAYKIANAIIQRRDELVSTPTRKYGFATWYDFNSFIDAIDNSGALGALVPPSRVTPIMLDSSLIRAQAIKDTIKANANPNSHISKFNPDRAFGSRWGDTDKGDLKNWTTEFCFNSNGSFEIESVGRVCGLPDGNNMMPVIAETVIHTAVSVFDVYRIGTQKEFVQNEIGGTGAASLVTYPENMADLSRIYGSSNAAKVAADYDGYLMLGQVDDTLRPANLRFFANYSTDFGADAVGPAEHGTSMIYSGTGGSPGVGSTNCLFNDGVFNCRSRRYANYAQWPGYWGAPNFGSVDDYVRNTRADQKIRMDRGTIDMWVKPTWGATGGGGWGWWGGGGAATVDPSQDFATQQYNSPDNPRAVSRRTLFSFGKGSNSTSYPAPYNSSRLEVSDNRIYMYAAYDTGGVYMFGSQGTRLCDVPPGLVATWYTTLNYGAHRVTDRSTRSRNHTNWCQLRSSSASDQELKYTTSTSAWNPKGWRYAGNWHHVRMTWNGQTAWLFVDGQPNPEGPVTSFRSSNVPAAPPAPTDRATMQAVRNWSLFIGSNRFGTDETNGYPCNADATIDDVQISQTSVSTTAFAPPQLYRARGTYQGKIGPRQNVLDSVVQRFKDSGQVACVAWTVNYPRFSGTPTSCSMEVGKVGSAYQTVTPSMTGVPPELQGRGTRVSGLSVAGGDGLDYRVTMTAGLPDQKASPILSDVSVMVIPSSPRFFYYGVE